MQKRPHVDVVEIDLPPSRETPQKNFTHECEAMLEEGCGDILDSLCGENGIGKNEMDGWIEKKTSGRNSIIFEKSINSITYVLKLVKNVYKNKTGERGTNRPMHHAESCAAMLTTVARVNKVRDIAPEIIPEHIHMTIRYTTLDVNITWDKRRLGLFIVMKHSGFKAQDFERVLREKNLLGVAVNSDKIKNSEEHVNELESRFNPELMESISSEVARFALTRLVHFDLMSVKNGLLVVNRNNLAFRVTDKNIKVTLLDIDSHELMIADNTVSPKDLELYWKYTMLLALTGEKGLLGYQIDIFRCHDVTIPPNHDVYIHSPPRKKSKS